MADAACTVRARAWRRLPPTGRLPRVRLASAGAAGVRGNRDGRARPCSTRARFRIGGLRGAVLLLDWRASGCIVRGSGDGANVRCRPCAPLQVGLQGQLIGAYSQSAPSEVKTAPRAHCAPERLAAHAGIRERLGQGTRGYPPTTSAAGAFARPQASPSWGAGFANNVRGIIGRWQGCSHGKGSTRAARRSLVACWSARLCKAHNTSPWKRSVAFCRHTITAPCGVRQTTVNLCLASCALCHEGTRVYWDSRRNQ